MDVVGRWVRSPDEVRAVFDVVGRATGRDFVADDRPIRRALARYDVDRELMLCVVDADDGDRVLGGAIAHGDDAVGLSAIGLEESLRGAGVGRWLVSAIEALAMARGARSITLGSVRSARGFYESLGYHGKRAMKVKELPMPGRVRDLRAAKLLAELGDLEVGQRLRTAWTSSTT